MSLPGREGREGRQGHERGQRSQPVRKPEKNKLTLLPISLKPADNHRIQNMQKSKFTDVKVDMVTHLEESREQVVVGEGKEHRGQHGAQAPV